MLQQHNSMRHVEFYVLLFLTLLANNSNVKGAYTLAFMGKQSDI